MGWRSNGESGEGANGTEALSSGVAQQGGGGPWKPQPSVLAHPWPLTVPERGGVTTFISLARFLRALMSHKSFAPQRSRRQGGNHYLRLTDGETEA